MRRALNKPVALSKGVSIEFSTAERDHKRRPSLTITTETGGTPHTVTLFWWEAKELVKHLDPLVGPWKEWVGVE